MDVQVPGGRGIGPADVHWAGIAIVLIAAIFLGAASAVMARYLLRTDSARPLAPAVWSGSATRVTSVRGPTVGQLGTA